MTKYCSVGIIFSLFLLNISAQTTTFSKSDILFEKEEFSVAQNLYLSQLDDGGDKDEIIYKIANCAKNLGSEDAVYWYSVLLNDFENSIYYQLSKKELSYIYFSDKLYSKSVLFLSEIIDEDLMDDEFHFKFAYSLFISEKYDEAKYHFSKIGNGKYKSLSLYYYAHISYVQKFYNKSLVGFQLLSEDKMFSKIVPYYISQIYFSLEKYSDLVGYAVPLLEGVIDSREVEMNRIVAEAYYQLSDFYNAEIYFNKYMELSKDIKMIDYFQLGQINVFQRDYDKAIQYLEKVENVEDSLLQYNSYYLGKSYLEIGKKRFALNAFKKASNINSDLELKEESLYNYFKLAYELDLPYTNLTYVLEEFSEFHLSKYKSEVKRLLVNMFQSTNQYQQAFDFLKDNHLPKQEQKETLQRLAYYIGVQHYNNANYTNALTKFEFARKHPENKEIDVMCLYWLSDCYYQLKDYNRSISHYKEYLSTPSNSLLEKSEIAKYNLAYSYFQSKNYTKSKEWFRKYLLRGTVGSTEKMVFQRSSVDSEIEKKRMHDAKLRLADSYYMLSDFENAAHYYHRSGLDIHDMQDDHFDMDYSVYQESQCYGLVSDYKHQEKCLKGIIENAKESPYYQRSLMDLATLYKNQNKSNKAIHNYNLVLSVSSNEEILSLSLLNMGLIYFNSNEMDSSVIYLKNVIENYPNTTSFKGAKLGLKDAYIKKGDVDGYLAYINKIPQLDISVASKDSLTFQVAYNSYKSENYSLSKTDFKSYISNFGEESIFRKQSLYYYSESCWKTSDTIGSISAYEEVLSLGMSVFYEPSLVRLCRYFYDKKDNMSSNRYYQILDTIASSNGLKRESVVRLMFGFENSKSELAVEYANRVLSSDKLNNRLIARSKIIIARNDYKNGNFARSSDLCDEIVSLTKNKDGSEAMYMYSYFAFLEEDYAKTEELVFQLAEEYSSNHWIAKGFILLSDVYMKQDNNYQAKATLESIIENHDEEDVVNQAIEKWEEIVLEEQLKNNIVVEEEVSIELGDTLGYDIIYSDLQIEEEF